MKGYEIDYILEYLNSDRFHYYAVDGEPYKTLSLEERDILNSYIHQLHQENLKYKEVINKSKRYIKKCLELSLIEDKDVVDDILDNEYKYILKILNEVSE